MRERAVPERPTLEAVKAYARTIGLAEWKAVDWFHEEEGCGWLDYAQRQIWSWRSVLNRVRTKWLGDGSPSGPPAAKNAQGPAGAQQRPTAYTLTKQAEALEEEIREITNRGHETAHGWTAANETDRQRRRELRLKVKELKEQLKSLT